MAVRGTVAKEEVTKRIKEAFGPDYVCYNTDDKKIYVWANDGGERVQIALSMTCPKTNIELTDVAPGDETSQISDKERENINQLIARLGL